MVQKKIMQGDSYVIPFSLTLNNSTMITANMVSEIELCVGDDSGMKIRKTLSGRTVWYDEEYGKWCFRPSQEETLALEPGSYEVIARMKFGNADDADVAGVVLGRLTILDTQSEEVI